MFGFNKIDKSCHGGGRAYDRKFGKVYVYIGWGSEIYLFHIEVGRVVFTVESTQANITS